VVIRTGDGVRKERTGYRDDHLTQRIVLWGDGFICKDVSQKDLDMSISPRHRNWGFNCPVMNLDCLMYEYDNKQPVSLIDFKCRGPSDGDTTSANAQALANLASSATIPAYIVYYDNLNWRFRSTPLNALGKIKLGECSEFTAMQEVDEITFVGFLYALRGRSLPHDVKQRLARETDQPDVMFA
jgi:hypothetical protein